MKRQVKMIVFSPTVGAKNVHSRNVLLQVIISKRFHGEETLEGDLELPRNGVQGCQIALSQSQIGYYLASKPLNGRFKGDKGKTANILKFQMRIICKLNQNENAKCNQTKQMRVLQALLNILCELNYNIKEIYIKSSIRSRLQFNMKSTTQ